MKRLSWAAVLLLFWPSYSFSEEVYGTTNNAAQAGLNWVMTNVLPEYAGLEVNGLIYQYTAVKDPETNMIVWVQNEYADGNGYIFGTLMIGLGFLAIQSQKHLPFPTCPQPCGAQDLSKLMARVR